MHDIIWIGTGSALGALAAAGGYVLFRRHESESHDRFRDNVINDAAAWIGRDLALPAEHVARMLTAWIETGSCPERLRPLQKISYRVELSPEGTSCTRHLCVVLARGTELLQGLIDRRIRYEDLPTTIRDDFRQQDTHVDSLWYPLVDNTDNLNKGASA